METIPLWFPHIGDLILDHSDNQSVIQYRCLNKIWKNFIDEAKLPWNEIMKMHDGNTDQWKMILRSFQERHGIISMYYKVNVDSQIMKWNEGEVQLNPLHIKTVS